MSTVRILLGIVCLAFSGIAIEPGGDILIGYGLRVTGYGAGCIPESLLRTKVCYSVLNSQFSVRNSQFSVRNSQFSVADLRGKIVNIARSQLGVREATGNNDGIKVGEYLKSVGLSGKYPWCAAFVSWTYAKAGFDAPRTAWSPALFPSERTTQDPKSADVYGIYSKELKRISHCGIIERTQHNWIIGIEGNTNTQGSREGDGVYRKYRHVRTIAKFSNWVK